MLDFLINYLIKENKNIYIKDIPQDYEGKKRLYRSLCNIREPLPISNEYIKAENEFLKDEIRKKKIIDSKDIKEFVQYKGAKICLWQGDITTLKVDAIVNAANSQGLGCFVPGHKCIDNAIHFASGINLRLECSQIMQKIGILENGKVFITSGYNLPSRYVIHTVGPIIDKEVTKKEEEELENCYINSLKIAKENNIKEVAFPCISTGLFCFPKQLASKIAIKAVRKYLDVEPDCFEKIIFNVYLDEDYKIYINNLGDVYGRL